MARSIEQLVERNVGLAAVRARQSQRPGAGTALAPRLPVVTVSREPGAGGTTIAGCVSRRLGFACWDQELLSRIASEKGLVESVLAQVDERAGSSVHDFVRSLLVGDAYSQDAYRTVLTKVVGSIALTGAAVIVGRGGHFILGSERALRVRVVCDIEERIRRVAGRDRISTSDASRRVKELDAHIRSFMKRHFNQDVTAPHHYDIIINSGTLEADAAARVVVSSYRAKFPDQVRESLSSRSLARADLDGNLAVPA